MSNKRFAPRTVLPALCLVFVPVMVLAASPAGEDEFLLHPRGYWGPIYRVESSGKIEPLGLNMGSYKDAEFHRPGQPLISPDQRWIAFTRENDLWLSAVDRELSYPISHVGLPSTDHLMSVYVTAWTWSPDSRFLIYRVEGNSTEGYCGCGGGPAPKAREAEYGYYRYDVERGTTLRLNEAENRSHFLMVEHVAWLEPKTFLVKSAAPRGTKSFPVTPREVDYGLPLITTPTNYFRVSLNGKKVKFVGGFEGRAWQEDISPDGKRLVAYVSRSHESGKRDLSQLSVLDLVTGEVRPLTEENPWHHSHQLPQFSPDGESIAYLCNRTICADQDCKQNEQRHYLKVDGKIVAHCTLGSMKFDWIDSRTIAGDCDVQLGVVDVRTSEVLNKIDVPQPE